MNHDSWKLHRDEFLSQAHWPAESEWVMDLGFGYALGRLTGPWAPAKPWAIDVAGELVVQAAQDLQVERIGEALALQKVRGRLDELLLEEQLSQLLCDCADAMFMRLEALSADEQRLSEAADDEFAPGVALSDIRESLAARRRESDPGVNFDGTAAYHRWLATLGEEDAVLVAQARAWYRALAKSDAAITHGVALHAADVADVLARTLTQISVRLQLLLPADAPVEAAAEPRLVVSAEGRVAREDDRGVCLAQLGELAGECLRLVGGEQAAEALAPLRGPFAGALLSSELPIPGFVARRQAGGLILAEAPPAPAVPAEAPEAAEPFPGELEVAEAFPELHDDLESVVCLAHELWAFDPRFARDCLDRLAATLRQAPGADCLVQAVESLADALDDGRHEATREAEVAG